MPERHEHWSRVYQTKGEQDVSWFEAVPAVSLELLDAAGLSQVSCVIDIGGGESRLVDHLVARGLTCLTVLDVAGESLARARQRLGDAGACVTWLQADVAGAWHANPVDIWHDRAVFHFLTDEADRASYVRHMREVVRPGGAALIATFAPDGPDKCSGLPVVRYSPETLAATIGTPFTLVESRRHEHRTPWRSVQAFQYSRFVRRE